MHTIALQKSRYLVIENDINQLMKTFKGNIKDAHKDLTLRYCLDEEVNRKNKKSLIFKTGFLVKVKNLQNNGEKLKLCHRIDMWLDDNIDEFTQNDKWTGVVKNEALKRKDTNNSIKLKHD